MAAINPMAILLEPSGPARSAVRISNSTRSQMGNLPVPYLAERCGCIKGSGICRCRAAVRWSGTATLGKKTPDPVSGKPVSGSDPVCGPPVTAVRAG